MSLQSRPLKLFADLELSRRLERAEAHTNARFVEARVRVFPESGAEWIEVAGAYAMFDGVSSPVTQTFGLGMFQEAEDRDLEEIERFFQERGAPIYHEVSPLAGLQPVALLNVRGYRPVEFTSVLYRPLNQAGIAQPLNERIRVRPIEKQEGRIWAEITVKGWSEIPELSDYLAQLGPIATERKDAVSFLAELEGRPIASGVLALSGGVAVLAGACTIPEARRQGAQLALLDTRLRYASAHGCDVAMMGALPGSASQRNAERHGFRIAYTRIKWQLQRGG